MRPFESMERSFGELNALPLNALAMVCTSPFASVRVTMRLPASAQRMRPLWSMSSPFAPFTGVRKSLEPVVDW